MKLKCKLCMLGSLFFVNASVYVPSHYAPRYTLLASEIHVEVGSKDELDPYQYLLRNRQPLREEDKKRFQVEDTSNLTTVGNYAITYDKQYVLDVVVEDTTAPSLSLAPLSLQRGASFSWNEEAYSTLIQELSDNYTAKEVLQRNVECEDIDTSLAGEREVSCSVRDESGNTATAQLMVAIQAPKTTQEQKPKTQTTSVASMQQTINIPSASYSAQDIAEIQQIAALVNQIRAENGLAPVSLDMGNYHNVTYLRTQEVMQSYSHTRPNGQACYTIFGEYGLGYSSSGENIAQGQQSAQEVVGDWMNSPTHRSNILRSEFTILSVGVAGSGANKIWVQEFFS